MQTKTALLVRQKWINFFLSVVVWQCGNWQLAAEADSLNTASFTLLFPSGTATGICFFPLVSRDWSWLSEIWNSQLVGNVKPHKMTSLTQFWPKVDCGKRARIRRIIDLVLTDQTQHCSHLVTHADLTYSLFHEALTNLHSYMFDYHKANWERSHWE